MLTLLLIGVVVMCFHVFKLFLFVVVVCCLSRRFVDCVLCLLSLFVVRCCISLIVFVCVACLSCDALLVGAICCCC